MLYDFVVKRSTDNGVIYYFFILEIYFTTLLRFGEASRQLHEDQPLTTILHLSIRPFAGHPIAGPGCSDRRLIRSTVSLQTG